MRKLGHPAGTRERPGVSGTQRRGTEMAKLLIMEGKRAGEVVDVPAAQQPLVIGNRKSAQISIRDPWISWDHASLSFDGTNFWLEDLGSSNGTYINKKKVSKAELKEGDDIWFGKTKCKFHLDDSKAPTATTSTAGPGATTQTATAAPAQTSGGLSPEAMAAAITAATMPLVQQLEEKNKAVREAQTDVEQAKRALENAKA